MPSYDGTLKNVGLLLVDYIIHVHFMFFPEVFLTELSSQCVYLPHFLLVDMIYYETFQRFFSLNIEHIPI